MKQEIPGPKLTLEQIGGIENPSYISVESKNPVTGYTYTFGFIFEHPQGPYIKIDTEPRSSFLTKGSEQQAQDALVELTKQTRRRSGGVLSVHPFYGAVWGTKLTPVSPGFLIDLKSVDDNLTMFVYLTNISDQFNEKLTKEALKIGTVVTVPSPKAERLLDYMRAPKANPNQSDRDQAITNGLGERWDVEFKKYHQAGDAPPAMNLNPDNIVRLMRKLEREVGITDLAVVDINKNS